jgi:hypothetical protein
MIEMSWAHGYLNSMEDKVCLIVVNEFFMRYDFIFFPLIFTELVLIEYVHMNQTTYVRNFFIDLNLTKFLYRSYKLKKV